LEADKGEKPGVRWYRRACSSSDVERFLTGVSLLMVLRTPRQELERFIVPMDGTAVGIIANPQ
jgi:hypothetical protein